MVRTRSSLSRLFALLRSESGAAVPTVLMMILIGLGLASAAAVASISAQRGSVRDEDSKQGIAAADAGALHALFRQNKLRTTDAAPCLAASGGQLSLATAQADGWCPEHTGTVGGATYAYRVSSPTPVGLQGERKRDEMKVVATGTSDEVSRRIAITASGITGEDFFGGSGAIGLDWVDIRGNAVVGSIPNPTGSETNGDISLEGSATLCGDVGHGVGASFEIVGSSATWCDGMTAHEGSLVVPQVDQGDAPTNNSNSRFFSSDLKTGPVTWDPQTRTLTLEGSSSLTLGGTLPYSFCKLEMSGKSTLIAGGNSQVRVFFDSPENCGQPAGTTQLSVTGQARIITTSQTAADMAFYFVGSKSLATQVYLAGTVAVDNNFILYAPNSDVSVGGQATYTGGIVGKTLDIFGDAQIQSDDSVGAHDVAVILVYRRDRYVECRVPNQGTTPDAGC
jgi:hypothetical protein